MIVQNTDNKITIVSMGTELSSIHKELGYELMDHPDEWTIGDLYSKKLMINDNGELVEDIIKTIESKRNNLSRELMALCDIKSQGAKTYINGKKVTAEQLQRYTEKYKMAVAYKTDGSYEEQLQLEADLGDITVQDLADLIVQLGDAYRESMNTFNSRIEAFRVKVGKLIAGEELDKAQEVLEIAKNFDTNTSDDDIKALFN